MRSRLVEQKAATYLDLFIFSQLHLVQEIHRELGGFFLIHLLRKTRALEEGHRNHVVVKLSSLLSMHANNDSVEEVADTGVVYLDSQSC